MRFGLAYVSYSYNEQRLIYLKESVRTLANTNIDGLETPLLHVLYKKSNYQYGDIIGMLDAKFSVVTVDDRELGNCGSVSNLILANGNMTAAYNVTHIMFIWDDFIFNCEWLRQLQECVIRNPDGGSWSVYRSNYKKHHQIIEETETDVVMSMHDGIGCVTKESWLEYSKSVKGYDVPANVPYLSGGYTIDLHHAYVVQGKKYATKRDYMQNLGRHVAWGIADVDCAIDFVGE